MSFKALCLHTALSCVCPIMGYAQDIVYINSGEENNNDIETLCKDFVVQLEKIQNPQKTLDERNEAKSHILSHTMGHGQVFSWVINEKDTEMHSPVVVTLNIVNAKGQIKKEYYQIDQFLDFLFGNNQPSKTKYEVNSAEFVRIDSIARFDDGKLLAIGKTNKYTWYAPSSSASYQIVHFNYDYSTISDGNNILPIITEIEIMQYIPKKKRNEKKFIIDNLPHNSM